MAGAAETTYPNLLAEFGLDNQAIETRLHSAWKALTGGQEDVRIYWPDGDGGYFVDTGNNDVRTEGVSYGMMMAVQMDDQDVFDRIWRWTFAHMRHADGPYAGYFAWSVNLDGTKRAQGPAPDGEEYFALALLFASHRWGDREPPFDYGQQARALLTEVVHKGESGPGHPMWDPATALIKFVPETDWSDPSYHLPHFYRLFAQWADPRDRAFWTRAEAASRAYLVKACHPVTGLAPEYANFDGTPHRAPWDYGHHHFFSDSYRVAANLGLDAAWFGPTPDTKALADKLQRFLAAQVPNDLRMYAIDGTPLEEPALHPVGLVATNAMASLATDGKVARAAVERFLATPLRTGVRRYYDNCLWFFALLALSGRYRIW